VKERLVPVTLERSDALSLIRLEGGVDIATAAELKGVLLEALESGKQMSVSVEAATSLDVTAVELLWAAEREARRSGVGFTLAGEVPEQISSTLIDAGFESFPVPGDVR
jgi:anti-anti-sigma regulatory factor